MHPSINSKTALYIRTLNRLLGNKMIWVMLFLLSFSGMKLSAAPLTKTASIGGATNIFNIPITENTLTTLVIIKVTGGTAPYTFRIMGEDSTRFNLDVVSGYLTFKTPPDYEKPSDVFRDNIYKIQIRATDQVGGIAKFAATFTVTNVDETPDAPRNLYAISRNNSNILKWSPSAAAAGITAYRIYRSEDSVTWPSSPTFVIPFPDTTYTDNNLVNGKFYFYRATAWNGSSESVYTNTDGSTPYDTIISKYMHFNGSTDYLVANDTLKLMSLSITDGTTMECWVRFTSKPASKSYILSRDYNGTNFKWYSLYYDPNGGGANIPRFVFENNINGTTISKVTSSFAPDTNTWYHVAGTLRYINSAPLTILQLYVNGNLQNYSNLSYSNIQENFSNGNIFSFSSNSRFVIGATTSTISPFTYGNFLNGDISEVSYWNIDLDATSIKNHMYTRLRGDEANLLGLWHLDTMFSVVGNKQVYDYQRFNINALMHGNVSCISPKIIAKDDAVTLLASDITYINVRKNDVFNLPAGTPTSNVLTKIVKYPSHGSIASVEHGDSLKYTPNCFLGKDTIKYLICDTSFFNNPYKYADTAIVVINTYDDVKPVINCPADKTINCQDDNSPTNTGSATATDNCDPSPAITYSDLSTYYASASNIQHYNYTITRTWKATDVSANFSTCAQTITVHDVTAPTFTQPAGLTINCNDSQLPSGTGNVTAADVSDNCAPSANLTISYTDASTQDANPANIGYYNYSITRTWKVTDVAGNATTHDQTITVHDVTAPTFTQPAGLTINCDASQLPANTGNVTVADVSDNCAPAANLTISYTDATTQDANPANIGHYNYSITRTWKVTDVAGNATTHDQTITVHDMTAPTFTQPAGLTINCDASQLPANTGNITVADVTDNCAPAANLTISYTDASAKDANPANIGHYNYTITRTWKVTDVASNATTHDQTITVHDVTAPTFTQPAGLTINCDASQLPAITGNVTVADVSDNCAPAANLTISYTDASTQDANPANIGHYNYTITRTWKVTDVAGNATTHDQTITVHDVTAPTFTQPAGLTINCDASQLPANTGNVTAADVSDNCAPAGNLTISYTDASTQDANPANIGHYNYTITRTWKVTDVANNATTHNQTITVHDVTAPTFTQPAGLTINCDASQLPANTGNLTIADVSDNCAPAANLTISYTDASTQDANPANIGHYNYTITRTWKVTDVAGNATTHDQTITVHDVTAPIFTQPAGLTINCDASQLPASTGNVTVADVSDNCAPAANLTISYTDASTQDANPANIGHYNYTITRTWKVTDVAGNATTHDQTITIHDVTVPTFTQPAGLTINCDASQLPANTGNVTVADVSDNCAPVANLTITYTDASTQDANPANIGHYNYTITRTWKVTDVAVNATTHNQTITVHDVTAPTFTQPAGLTINCDASQLPANTGNVTVADVTDNCAPAANLTISYTDASTQDANPANIGHYNYTIARTWKVTDVAGNATTHDQTITVHDVTAPTFTQPAGLTINCDASQLPASTGNITVADVSDNCAPAANLIISYTDANTQDANTANIGHYNYSITRTWKVTDVANNATTHNQTITVHDVTAPTFTQPAGLTINCDASQLPANTGNLTVADVTDNCAPAANLTISYTDASTQDANPANIGHYNYTITRTWKVTDVAGNATTHNQTITVHDVTASTFTQPAGLTINCDASQLPASTGNVTVADVSDNCAPAANLTISYTDASTQNANPANIGHYNYTITRTWKVTDVAGNATTHDQTITVHDVTAPTITCLANQTRSTDANKCTYKTAGTEFDPTSFSDNCSGTTISNDYNGGNTLAGEVFNKGTTTITWTVKDVSGNTATCSFNVIIQDLEIPTINCMVDKSRNTHAGRCDYTTVGSEFDPPSFSDNCPGATIINNYNSTNSLTGAIFPKGITTVTWTVTDASGNIASCNFKVTIQDHENPTISCVANQTRNTDAGACTYTAVGTEFDPTAFSDNCPGSTISNNFNSSNTLAGAVFPKGTTTVIWTVKDADGNTATCNFKVDVQDHENPTISCTGNKIVSSDLNQSIYTHSGTGWDATGNDNCNISGIAYTLSGATTGSGTSLNGVTFNLGLTTVSWTITDGSGNTATCSYTVQVNDSQIPTISCISNKTVSADLNQCTYSHSGVAWDATGGDNAPGWAISYALTGATTGSGSSLNGVVFNKGITTVTWTNIDASSNIVSCSYTVTVNDTQNPTISCTGNKIVSSDLNQCFYTQVGTTWDAVGSDNCTGYSVIYVLAGATTGSGTSLNNVVFNKGLTNVTWTITDASSNTATCSFTVTVNDTQNPTINCTSDKIVNTDLNQCTYSLSGTAWDATGNDNCPGSTISYALTGATTGTGSSLTGIAFNAGLTTVTWTNMDASGNAASCSYTVTVNDNQNPTIAAPADVTVNADAGSCAATAVSLGTPITTDNCSVASVTSNAPSSFPVGTTVVTWTATDIHGNIATANQNVIVSDNQNPTITAPTDVTINADAGSCAASVVALGTPVTADNCGVASISNNAPAQFSVGTTTITWTVTDIHGNMSTASQLVIVNDNQKPTITAPADITVNSDAGYHVATGVALGTPVTADNCGIISVSNDAPSSIPAGVNTVTWTVTDIHGNSSTATQIVTVIDNLPPTITSVTAINIAENTSSVMTVIATDPDAGDVLRFSVTGGVDASKFTMDAITGALSFITPPNYEIPMDANKDSIYEVDVTVKDQGGMTDTKTILVKVTNVNDPPTDIILSKSSVDEHQPSGTIVGLLTTIDEDSGDSHTYTLSGTNATLFAIAGDSLKTTAAFDYMVKPSYSIVIRTTDSQGAYFEKTFTISVNNINEAPVILNASSTPTDTLNFDVFENETTQKCLHVTDPDNDITAISELHSIDGSGTLSIDPNSKTCFIYTPLPGFLGKETVFARVCDNGVPSLCDTVIITMNVIPRFIFSQVISPNGDGINDTWVIGGLERFPDNKVTIFSRWGDIVYKAKGYDNVNVFWNGDYNNGKSSKGIVPDGTYFYIIELGNGSKLNGFVVLNR